MVSNIAEREKFNISHLFAHIVFSIWPIDRTLLGATTLGQSVPESNGNEGVLYIPQISKAGVLPSNGLMSYPGHLLGVSYPSAEMQLVYSTASANWALYGLKFHVGSQDQQEISEEGQRSHRLKYCEYNNKEHSRW